MCFSFESWIFNFNFGDFLVSSCLWVANPANYTEISLGFTEFTELKKVFCGSWFVDPLLFI